MKIWANYQAVGKKLFINKAKLADLLKLFQQIIPGALDILICNYCYNYNIHCNMHSRSCIVF